MPDIASVLIENGADADLVDAKGKTALDHAIGEKNMGVAAVLDQSNRTSLR